MGYSIDTSSLIDAWYIYYQPGTFLSLWKEIEELGKSGILCAPKEVKDELKTYEEREDNPLYRWGQEQAHMFVDQTPEMQIEIQRLSDSCKRLVRPGRLRPDADPYVIALAKVNGWTVITEEKRERGQLKIPNVCEHYEIDCIDICTFVHSQGWCF